MEATINEVATIQEDSINSVVILKESTTEALLQAEDQPNITGESVGLTKKEQCLQLLSVWTQALGAQTQALGTRAQALGTRAQALGTRTKVLRQKGSAILVVLMTFVTQSLLPLPAKLKNFPAWVQNVPTWLQRLPAWWRTQLKNLPERMRHLPKKLTALIKELGRRAGDSRYFTKAYYRAIPGRLRATAVTVFTFIKKTFTFKKGSKVPYALLAVAVITIAIGAATAFYYNTTETVVVVYVNDLEVGLAGTEEEVHSLVDEALLGYGASLGVAAKTKDEVEYDSRRLPIGEWQPLTQAEVTAMITPYIDGYALTVGEEILIKAASAEAVIKVLDQYKAYYVQTEEGKTVESVDIEDVYAVVAIEAPPEAIMTEEEAFAHLLEGGSGLSTYTVEAGESLWIIASKNDLTVEEITAANEGLTTETMIHPGQSINLSEEKPYLTVVAKGTAVQQESIPYSVVTKTDSEVAAGRSVVQQAGQTGSKDVTYSFVEKNGKIIAKEVLEEVVISAPVDQIVAKGPAPVVIASSSSVSGASRGGGNVPSLSWPISGNVTSNYGYRGGSLHSGMDIDGYTGQPFYAAAAGTVVGAGWMSSYGYCILLDHGDGVITRYAHASQLYVGVGDVVSKGQNIGLVGSTGNSTGSHMHFEVIINGSTVNPRNYL
jgi:murein DD-endopeptidase MepM/ murein hydrolase activator NlpD